ncbi:MAG: M15 family metallopeptidase [Eubacterium sp.]|nr:M15 family metallopeptidase [Eubacterium sp.]
MNENGSFMDWLKLRWKMISVSDTRFFRFIWIVAISITLVTVLISAGVTASNNKKLKAEEEQKAAEEVAAKEEEEAAMLATITDATATDATSDVDAWMTILISASSPLPEGYEVPEFTELRGGKRVDSRIYPELQRMFDDARAQGYSPYVDTAYIDNAGQQELFDEKVQEFINSGMTDEQAKVEAGNCVAQPGTSEHQSGLAIDVYSDAGDEDQTALWTWLNENSYKYGYIVRYPENKVDITGVSYESCHLRYVGVDAANIMFINGWCLEEFLTNR